MPFAPQCLDSRGPECLRSVTVIGSLDVRARLASDDSRSQAREQAGCDRSLVAGRDRLSDHEIHEHEMADEGYRCWKKLLLVVAVRWRKTEVILSLRCGEMEVWRWPALPAHSWPRLSV